MASELCVWLHNNPYDNKKEAKPHSDAILQQLLQNTMNTSGVVDILTNNNGKPFVEGPIFFSHSNSANLYAYVVVNGYEIAIDVEEIKPSRHVIRIALRHFHTDEIEFLKNQNEAELELQFYKLWTRKEAWCKLDGGVLWHYLRRSVLTGATVTTLTGEQVYFQTIPHIKGFACSIASTQNIEKIWLNSIGAPTENCE